MARPYDHDVDQHRPRRSSSHVHDRHADRDWSPPRSSGGTAYVSGALPPIDGMSPRALFPRASSNTLQVPQPGDEYYQLRRSRSAAGSYARSPSRRRHDDHDDDVDDDHHHHHGHHHHRSRSPMEKARHMLHHTFSDTSSGLGVGVLGAIVGGLAAREASEAAAKHNNDGHHDHRDHDEDGHSGTLISTIVGAAVGGLGANALEKRFEKSRHRHRAEQEECERKFGRHGDRENRHRHRDVEEGRRSRPTSHDSHGEHDHVYEVRRHRRDRVVG